MKMCGKLEREYTLFRSIHREREVLISEEGEFRRDVYEDPKQTKRDEQRTTQ